MDYTTDERATLLQAWIRQQFDIAENSFTAVSGDASFRRYFRFTARHAFDADNISLIAVDAPPSLENSQRFIDIASLLTSNNIPAPKIYSIDLEQGFYLQQDFGDRLFLDALSHDSANEYYIDAINKIIDMQHVDCSQLPMYDSELLHREMNLFKDWYIAKHLDTSLSQNDYDTLCACFDTLEHNALEQPQTFVHRDYHSRNLMVRNDNTLGIIDFQDAVKGAITYDLVSLLRDCYISWPQNDIDQWLNHFYQLVNASFPHLKFSLEQLTRWFDLMGIQRHLKATGIFCRLNYRDGKSAYLNDIPRTLDYIITVSEKYPELSQFNQLICKLK